MSKKQNIWKAKLIFALLVSIIYILILNSGNLDAKETGRNTNNKSSFVKSLIQSTELLKLKINSPMTLGEYTVDKLQTDLQSVMQNSERDIVFIENLGQIRDSKGNKKSDVLFLTRSQGVDMYITSSGITYVFRGNPSLREKTEGKRKDKFKAKDIKTSYYRLDMEFVGMNKNFDIEKELAIEQHFNYYTPEYPNGISPKGYKKITLKSIYDGIDLVYYEKEGKMKYDFIIKAGTDPDKIKMKYKGAGTVYIDKDGSVIVTTPMGEIREDKPYTYSKNTGIKIESGYKVEGNLVQFAIAEYDKIEDIIVDPYRIWATYYGGSGGDQGWAVCTDNAGNLYVTGETLSTNFPTQTLTGAYNQTTLGSSTGDAFILKFNSSGARLWATYYGGNSAELGYSICTDNTGNLYVTGKTQSTNFPTQTLTGAYNQTTLGGSYGYTDAFILKFDSIGARAWATYYGGSDWDEGYSICTDNSGTLYVTGRTKSTDFPTQFLLGSYNQTTLAGSYGYRDAFILRFNSSGALIWATYYGGSNYECGNSICTDNQDNLYVTGETMSFDFQIQILPGAYNQTYDGGDAFILKFDSSGVRKWATFYGGSSYDYGNSICTDNPGNLYVTGYTGSYNFPIKTLTGAYNQTTYGGGYRDAFILKFNSSSARLWATYYGGGGIDRGNSICTDNPGNLYVTGFTASTNFPIDTLTGAYNQTTLGGIPGDVDAFILKFSSSGARIWASYYGGSWGDRGNSICTDSSDYFYVTGSAGITFPTKTWASAYNQTTYGGGGDAFILKFRTTPLSAIKNTSNEIPEKYSLHQNYPNPFNPTTNIKFNLPKTSETKLIIYDALGREVAILVNERLNAGLYEYNFDGTGLTSGIYFYSIKALPDGRQAGEFVETKKMLLVK